MAERAMCGAAREPGLACRLQYRCFVNSSGTRPVLIRQHRVGLPVIFQPGSICISTTRCGRVVPSGLFHPGHAPGDRPARRNGSGAGWLYAAIPPGRVAPKIMWGLHRVG
jgi:hypothetical protein